MTTSSCVQRITILVVPTSTASSKEGGKSSAQKKDTIYMQWRRKQFLNGGGSSFLNGKKYGYLHIEQLDKSSLLNRLER